MLTLMQRSFPNASVSAYEPGFLPGDIPTGHAHLYSLPLLMRERGEAKTALTPPHIRVDPVLRDRFRREFQSHAEGRTLVGINWRGPLFGGFDGETPETLANRYAINSENFAERQSMLWRKCVNLVSFSSLFEATDLQPVSIQYGIEDWEHGMLSNDPVHGRMILDEIDYFGDLDVIAARIAALDCMITTATGHAHLAAAVGVPTFVLYQSANRPLWSYQSRHPHYPDVTLLQKPLKQREDGLFDRQYAGDWRPAIAEGVRLIRERFLN